jgi:hypothetical protein
VWLVIGKKTWQRVNPFFLAGRVTRCSVAGQISKPMNAFFGYRVAVWASSLFFRWISFRGLAFILPKHAQKGVTVGIGFQVFF